MQQSRPTTNPAGTRPRSRGLGAPRAFIAVAALCCGVAACFSWSQTHRQSPRDASDGLARSNRPLRIRPLVQASLDVSPEEWEWIRGQIQPLGQGRTSVSVGLHLLRVHRREGKLSDPVFSSGDAILKLLTDQKASTACFGGPALIRTRHGLRFPTIPSDQSGSSPGNGEKEFHRDQCLSAFGELGIPLSFPATVDGGSYELRDVLRDSIANFYMGQRELNWTAMAYILYLPPEKTWVNRYGERFSFDDLAEELFRRPLEQASCAGTHLTFTLTMLERADELIPILTDPVRVRLRERLKRDVDAAVRNQQADGHWSLSWHVEPARQNADHDSPLTRLLATGHLMEWMMYLPASHQLPAETKRRGAQWLLAKLREPAPRETEDNFCPYSHATLVLRAMARPVPHPVNVKTGLKRGEPSNPGVASHQFGADRTGGQCGRRGSTPEVCPIEEVKR
jgi:hypothetical protein